MCINWNILTLLFMRMRMCRAYTNYSAHCTVRYLVLMKELSTVVIESPMANIHLQHTWMENSSIVSVTKCPP